jgi:hypothetical protein
MRTGKVYINISPYHDSSADASSNELTLYCMDCVENPYTWYITVLFERYNSLKCTYDYSIVDGNSEGGVYTKVDRENTELYYVFKDDGKVSLCLGCDSFCSGTDPSLMGPDCHLVKNKYQTANPQKFSYVKCLKGHYFDNLKKECLRCLSNCENC